ncbi:gamma-glutamyl hydrolase [Drosophila bipectinata]|uniref:gamma-glutamyl hydrolase n=1 Tax=Drosophila bipectinata TaxID=42026 RepID=UPI001C896B4E|nr:gamma-glutamyl hydrolase [Drosophila bipectinata]
MTENHVPTVGVMCIDIATKLQEHFGKNYHSYIAASYVKYLEASGAHIVPVWIGRSRAYYEQIVNQLNGILLPGGAVFIDAADMKNHPNLTNDCVASAEIIYQLVSERNQLARRQNDAGGYFPLWGTCLGFQLILIHACQMQKVRTDCANMQTAMPVHLSKDYKNSQLFGKLPDIMAEKMGKEPCSCHHHHYCITKESLESCNLSNNWHPLATQKDPTGLEFITVLEHRRFPIFGCQFHPERAAFEQLFASEDLCQLGHSQLAIDLAQVLGTQFVKACRRNRNRFSSGLEKARHLIWNWQPVFCGHLKDSHWLQCYIFEKVVDYPKGLGSIGKDFCD